MFRRRSAVDPKWTYAGRGFSYPLSVPGARQVAPQDDGIVVMLRVSIRPLLEA